MALSAAMRSRAPAQREKKGATSSVYRKSAAQVKPAIHGPSALPDRALGPACFSSSQINGKTTGANRNI
jgi:hypothetical protein